MSQLIQIKDQIWGGFSQMNSQWNYTTHFWNDDVRYRFERDFIQKFPPLIQAYMKQVEQLDRAIEQAKKDVK